LDVSYQHIYLGHPLKLKGVWAYIILGDFTGATPSNRDDRIKKQGEILSKNEMIFLA
jgi:hypothetical protein